MSKCKSTLFSCRCDLEAGHEGDHECECGGMWDADLRPTRMPQRIVKWCDTQEERDMQETVLRMAKAVESLIFSSEWE